jgi:hypothetical protein
VDNDGLLSGVPSRLVATVSIRVVDAVGWATNLFSLAVANFRGCRCLKALKRNRAAAWMVGNHR